MGRTIDWRYHRPGCQSCKRTETFLAEHQIEDGVVRSASKEPIVGADALDVLEGVRDLVVAKGGGSVQLDLTRNRPVNEDLLALLLGRSGKLRAPAVRVGTTLIVGYNDGVLKRLID